MRVSNVDKHTKDDEQPVRLCNYVDVYKNDRIRSGMAFMRATATTDEIERFRLRSGDVLITRDSEAWNDIGVSALVEDTQDDIVSGYHLALLRPFPERVDGGFLFRALQSTAVAAKAYTVEKRAKFGRTADTWWRAKMVVTGPFVTKRLCPRRKNRLGKRCGSS